MRDRYKEALSILDSIMSSNPPWHLKAMTLSELGEIEYRLGNYDKSIELLEEFKSFVSDISDQQSIHEQIQHADEIINAARSQT